MEKMWYNSGWNGPPGRLSSAESPRESHDKLECLRCVGWRVQWPRRLCGSPDLIAALESNHDNSRRVSPSGLRRSTTAIIIAPTEVRGTLGPHSERRCRRRSRWNT